MSEKFTWSCLWANSCDECMVGRFVRDNRIEERQQKQLLSAATAAGYWLDVGESPDRVATRLIGQYQGLTEEGVRVAIDGFVQWQDSGCQEKIRPLTEVI